MWTDSHCHISDDPSGDETVARAVASGVTRMIAIGTDRERSIAAIGVAGRHPGVFATVGLHPHEATAGSDSIADLVDPARQFVVGVGECGLDFFYEHSPKDAQRKAFAEQVQMAAERNLTLVIHTRNAWDETFDILGGETLPSRWVLHCFTGGLRELHRCLDLGGYVSFSGIVTFKNADGVREAAADCPLDRILVETDSPYLAPVPHRGKPNEPAWVGLVGAAVGALRGLSAETLAKATWDNATAAFRIPDSPRWAPTPDSGRAGAEQAER
jgi:TatD DNase family protein